jgi:hypothetical protein
MFSYRNSLIFWWQRSIQLWSDPDWHRINSLSIFLPQKERASSNYIKKLIKFEQTQEKFWCSYFIGDFKSIKYFFYQKWCWKSKKYKIIFLDIVWIWNKKLRIALVFFLVTKRLGSRKIAFSSIVLLSGLIKKFLAIKIKYWNTKISKYNQMDVEKTNQSCIFFFINHKIYWLPFNLEYWLHNPLI